MRLRTFLTPLCFSLLGVACNVASVPAQAAPTPTSASASTPTSASGRLAADPAGNELTMGALHVLSNDAGNVFFSGTSLRGALGMTALGADGQTLAEMVAALHLDADPSGNVTHAQTEALLWKRAAGSAELAIANRLWIEDRFTIDSTFAQRAADGYGASAARLDFQEHAEPARLTINDWVKVATHDKIPELLPPRSVDSSTRLVLTNAVYFKGTWTDGFSKSATFDAPFHAASGDVRVPTMHRTGAMSVGENDSATLVELPYKDSGLSMLVVLPKNGGLHALESTLTANELGRWVSGMQKEEIGLAMPKFTFSWGRSVKADLEQMGIHRLFTGAAELTKMAAPGVRDERLYVSDVVHKSFVLVDETGTEAAAATGVTVAKSSAIAFHRQVNLDVPFLFFVRDRATGNVLFAGRLANPKA